MIKYYLCEIQKTKAYRIQENEELNSAANS